MYEGKSSDALRVIRARLETNFAEWTCEATTGYPADRNMAAGFAALASIAMHRVNDELARRGFPA